MKRVSAICVGVFALCMFGCAFAQNAVESDTKLQLEINKLQEEIRKLQLETDRLEAWPSWVSNLVALVTGIVGTAAMVWVARRTRRGAMDQVIHERRVRCYPKLVKATEPLAIYFPDLGEGSTVSLTPEACAEIGRELSSWYFSGGGLLMSRESRDCYFYLARALTLAAVQKTLRVPAFPSDAALVSRETLSAYKARYPSELDRARIDEWSFEPPASTEPHQQFKDFVLLQSLSSALRTSLATDLRSRRRPT